MKGLLIITDGPVHTPIYKVVGPITSQEAALYTNKAYMVILLCDSKTAKADKDSYSKFLSCVENSPLRCRKELQIKTMEYLIGTTLSEMVSIQSFPEPTRVVFEEVHETFNKTDENNNG